MFNSYAEDFCHYAALTKPIDPNVIIDLLLSVVHSFLSPGYPDFLVLAEEISLELSEVKANAVGEEEGEWKSAFNGSQCFQILQRRSIKNFLFITVCNSLSSSTLLLHPSNILLSGILTGLHSLVENLLSVVGNIEYIKYIWITSMNTILFVCNINFSIPGM